MQSLSKCNEEDKYLLCAIDIFSKYAWVVTLKDKKGVSIVNAFQKIISERRKPNKIWVNQGSEFYNTSFKYFLKKIALKCIQLKMKKKVLLLKNSLGRWKTRLLNHDSYLFWCIGWYKTITQFIELLKWNQLTLIDVIWLLCWIQWKFK